MLSTDCSFYNTLIRLFCAIFEYKIWNKMFNSTNNILDQCRRQDFPEYSPTRKAKMSKIEEN